MVNEFCGFKHGVIGTDKMPADTTLNNMKKADLIKLLHTAQHNYKTLMWFYNNAVKVNMSQLNNNGWIPCSERLPKENTEIIVIVRELDGGCYVRTTWLQDGQWIIKKSVLEPTVIAWMPMPEVYRPNELDAKPCASTECVYQSEEPCPAAVGCAGYEESEEQSESEQTPISAKEKEIIEKICECDMNVSQVAKTTYMHRNTVAYHLGRIKEKTGLDPMRFNDLVELRKMVD